MGGSLLTLRRRCVEGDVTAAAPPTRRGLLALRAPGPRYAGSTGRRGLDCTRGAISLNLPAQSSAAPRSRGGTWPAHSKRGDAEQGGKAALTTDAMGLSWPPTTLQVDGAFRARSVTEDVRPSRDPQGTNGFIHCGSGGAGLAATCFAHSMSFRRLYCSVVTS